MLDLITVYRIRSNLRTTKFTKMTGLQAFQKNIFENQRKLTIYMKYDANDR